jgi:ribosomal protein S18
MPETRKEEGEGLMDSVVRNWLDKIANKVKLEIDPPAPSTARPAPKLITSRKSADFWLEDGFYKDGHPVAIDEFIEGMLGMYPSPGQYEILYELAGRDPYEWDRRFQQYNLAIGQGGGKNTYIISPFTIYTAYRIANMKDPWKYFSRFFEKPLDYGTKFEMTNSSMVTERQAKDVHFSKLQSLIRRCKTKEGENWFAKHTGLDVRQSFGDLKAKTITIPTQPECGSIVLHSFDSTPSAPEGLHILLGIVDEASRADTEATYLDMGLLWKMLIGNTNTRFPDAVGKVINFSYLNNSEYDMTHRLLQEAEEEKKHTDHPIIFAVNKSTFETNPNVKKTDRSIQQAYRNDPADALARYEGVKGASREGFYQPHVYKIAECFFEMESPVDYEFGTTERIVEDPQTKAKKPRRFVKVDLTRIKGDNRVRGWAFDAGVSIDAFILKGGYIDTMDEMRDELFIENRRELVVMNKRPVVDVVIVWQPRDGMTVDYLNVGEVLGILLDKFPNSRFGNSDKYNSEKLRQEIMARGVSSETYQFGNTQQVRLYKKLRWMFWNNIPQIGKDTQHSIRKGGITKTVGEWNLQEHERLLRINENKVDHPKDGSKDLADVDAILCNDLAGLEVTEVFGAAGLETMTDYKRLMLAEKFIGERFKVQHKGVRGKEMFKAVAEAMQMSIADTQTLNAYVNEKYPQFREYE